MPSAGRAIIDIGSNTVRLVVYEGPARAPLVLYNEKISARLGKAVAEDGKLSRKATTAALAALGRYAMLLRMEGITDIECVATAAVRDASNGAAFLDQVRELGLPVRLLSGEQEAQASAEGVRAAFPGASGMVGDLGGGSLELIDFGTDGFRHGVTLPLGSLRLAALRDGGGDTFARTVKRMLRQSGWSGAHRQPFYLVGGSWRALARFAMLREDWPVDDPHGYELAPETALKLARTLTAMRKAQGLRGKGASLTTMSRLGPSISASRVASLPDAAALLAVLVRALKPSKLIFSGWGLREGLLASRLDASAAASDPLLAGVTDFVRRVSSDLPESARQVARWCKRAAPIGAGLGKTLRLSATMLALASMRTEPNLRAEQAADWALRKRWIGIDAEGRAMLALAVRANSARTAIPPAFARMASPARLREALAWGLAVRLCRRMTLCTPAALAGTALVATHDRLILAARESLAMLHTETVAKDHRLLAECLGLQPEFIALPEGAPFP